MKNTTEKYFDSLDRKRFILYIDLENAAFTEKPVLEISRILNEISQKIKNQGIEYINHYKTIFDYNGNDIGRYAVKPRYQAIITEDATR